MVEPIWNTVRVINYAATGFGADSEAFAINEFVIRDNPDRQPRHIEGLHPARDVALNIGDHSLNARFQSLIGLGGFGSQASLWRVQRNAGDKKIKQYFYENLCDAWLCPQTCSRNLVAPA